MNTALTLRSAAVAVLAACGSADAITYRALMVGPNYPGGGFDARIAADRMTDMSTQFARWGNWNAANISVLSGGVTPAQITNGITNSGTAAGDVFVFMYHGHGTYRGDPLPGGNPAGDPPDERFWLPGGAELGEGAIRTALAALPANSWKLMVNLSCYGGGMWDPIQNVNRVAFIAGCGERQTLPERVGRNGPTRDGQPFYWNLFQNADPANLARVDTNRDNAISVAEWYNASAVGGSMIGNRWDPDFLQVIQSDYQSEFHYNDYEMSNTTLFQVPGPGGVTLAAIGGLMMLRRRRV